MSFKRDVLLAFSECGDLARRVADRIEAELEILEAETFEDGEGRVVPKSDIRGRRVFVMRSFGTALGGQVDQKICQLLFLSFGLRDLGAERITMILPYLPYSRQDRRVDAQAPVTNRYLASLLECSGVDLVMTVDVHNLSAFENAYRCQTIHLECTDLFARHFSTLLQRDDVVVVSPDVGGVRRARRFADVLGRELRREIPIAVVEKARFQREVKIHQLLGDVSGKVALIYDDMISTGKTLLRAATACTDSGAKEVLAAATHGLFCGKAEEYLAYPGLRRVVVTDSLPNERLSAWIKKDKLVTLGCADLIAAEIRRAMPPAAA